MKQLLRELAIRLRAGRRSRRAAPRHRRIWVEPLEKRALLAQLVNVGTAADVIFNLPATASVVFLEDDGIAGNGVSQIRSSNATFDTTTFANPSGSLKINRGSTEDTLTINGLPDFTAGLTIGSAVSPFGAIDFVGALAMAADKNLNVFSNDTINLSSISSTISATGSGSVGLTTTRNVSLSKGSSLTVVNGNLTISANQQVTPTTGFFSGVAVIGGTIRATGTGAVTVLGKGGTDNFGAQYGVQLESGGKIIGGTSGLLTVQGTGGASSGGGCIGVSVATANSLISSIGGNVSIIGRGGGKTSANSNIGINIYKSQVSVGGNGNLTLDGTGGSVNELNRGVSLYASSVSSDGGNIQITGAGGGAASSSFGSDGVQISQGSTVTAGGNGAISINGTGIGGGNSSGVVLQMGINTTPSAITSSGGNIQITGRGGGDSASQGNYGVYLESEVRAGGSGSITIQGMGGAGALGRSTGVSVEGIFEAGGGGIVETSGGNITITGQGGGSQAGEYNVGVQIYGRVRAGGTASVAIQGTGGATSGNDNYGVHQFGTVTSSGGNVQLIGRGGGKAAAGFAAGVWLNGITSAGGTGSVSVQGTGGPGTGFSNVGVKADAYGVSTSSGGDVQVTGIEGSGSLSFAIVGTSGTLTTAVNGGALTLVGDSMSLDESTIVSANATSSVTLKPYTAAAGINLGLATNAHSGTLGLTDGALDRVTAGTINIGDGSSGAITVSGTIDRSVATNLRLTTANGKNIAFSGSTASLNSAGGSVALIAGGTGAITSGTAAADIIAGAGAISLSAGSGGIGTSSNNVIISTSGALTTVSANGSQFITDSVGPSGLDMSAGTSPVTLTVNAGAVSDADALTDISASAATIILKSVTPQNIGSAANPLALSVNSAQTHTGVGGGNQFLTNTKALTFPILNAGSGNISLTLLAQRITNLGSTGITANALNITYSDPTKQDFGGGFPLQVSDLTIDTSAGGGGIYFTNSKSLTALSLNAGSGNVSFDILSGTVADDDTAVDVTGAALTVSMLAQTNPDFGTAAHPIGTNVDGLAIDTMVDGGSIYVAEENGLTSLDLFNGFLALGIIDLKVMRGGIVDGDSAFDLSAGTINITLDDPTPQSFGTDANPILSAGSDLTIDTAAGGGSQFIVEHGASLTAVYLNAGTGDITLDVPFNRISDNDAAADIIARAVTITCGSTFLQTDIGTAINPIGASVLSLTADTSNGGGSLYFAVVSDLQGLDLKAGTGNITLSGGKIADADADVDVAAVSASITAASYGSSSNPIGTDVDSLSIETALGMGNQYIKQEKRLSAINLNAGLANVTLEVLHGEVVDNDGLTDITAALLAVILDDTTKRNFGSATNPITTSVDSLAVNSDAGGGDQFIAEVDSLGVESLNAGMGSITLTQGTFDLAHVDAVGDNSTLVVQIPAVVNLASGDETVGALAGGVTVAFRADGENHGFLVGANNVSTTFSGSVSGDDAVGTDPLDRFIKIGTGTFTLSGINPFTGSYEVNGGTLLVSGSIDSGSALVSVKNPGSQLGGNGTIERHIDLATGTIFAPGTSPGILSARVAKFERGAALMIELNGIAVGQQYDQLHVTGSVDLTGAALILTGTYNPAVGDAFIIINNDGEEAVIGEFDNLPDGKVFGVANGVVAGNYKISYRGGDGNDVVLTVINTAPSFDRLAGNYSAADENPVTHGPAGEQRILGWATNVSAGPANEVIQKLTFVVTVDKPGLFTANGQPAVGLDGALTFTPQPNAFGVANISVVLRDDGGGTNSSEPVTIQIEITKPRGLHNSAEAGERNGLDVTGATSSEPDGSIAANDALAVINYINAHGSGPVSDEVGQGPPYCDVTGDDNVAADDVLAVINYLNAGNPSEGEASGAVYSAPSAQSAAELFSILAADLVDAQMRRRRAGAGG